MRNIFEKTKSAFFSLPEVLRREFRWVRHIPIGPVLVILFFLLIPVFGYLLWKHANAPVTLDGILADAGGAGEAAVENFRAVGPATLSEEADRFVMADSACH